MPFSDNTEKFDVFSTKFAQDIFLQKYSMNGTETWSDTCTRVVNAVCGQLLDTKTKNKILKFMQDRKFIPGGRYLYSAGRSFHQVNNCFLFRAEDTREGWADLMGKASSALLTGGGIGIDYSKIRHRGAPIRRTGGFCTGPISLAEMVNEAGRFIMQGGARRCLPGGSKVSMADGSKKDIRFIQAGDLVDTRHGPKRVIASVEQGTQPLVKITTENGAVISSPEHSWLGANSARSKTWIRAKNLSLNNKLYFHPTTSELSYNGEDLNYYYTVGYFIGDGCAYSSGRTHEVTFQFSNDWKDEEQLNRISTVMEKLGSNPIVRDGHGECTELRCRSKDLVGHFQKYKYPHESPNIGTIAAQSQRVIAAVLAGWIDSDGYLNDDKWCISTAKKETASKIQYLFNKLNIVTSVSQANTAYEVRVCSYQRSALFKYMGEFSTKLKTANYDKNTAEIPSEIIKIEMLPPENTFDIQVEDVEEFIADGFVSHNSAIWAGLEWSHKDIYEFLNIKNYSPELKAMKAKDFNFRLPMEYTNISVIYDTNFFIAIEDEAHPSHKEAKDVWMKNCLQAFSTAEPGMSFNFRKDAESLRNACVTGDTLILTDDGYKPIESLVDQVANVWNGFEWSEVCPKITGLNQEIFTVSFSDGRVLNCTPNHKFHIANGYSGKSDVIDAKDLEAGMKLIKHNFPVIEHGEDYKYAYTQGFISAEGMDGYDFCWVYEPKRACLNRLQGNVKAQYKERLAFKFDHEPLPKSFVPFKWNLKSKLDWLAGLFDGDGTELKEGGLQLASVDRVFLTKLQALLSTLGAQSKIVMGNLAGMRSMPDGHGGHKNFNCQTTWRVCIGAVQMQELESLGLKCERMSFDKTPQRDASQFVKIVDVTSAGMAEKVYCFNESKRHLGIFNGVLTGQCTEVVSEDDSDKCNLGTVWMNRCKDKEEFAEVVKFSTLFLLCGGIYSDVPTDKIKEVGLKNNRIGLGLGGMHEWLMTRGYKYQCVPELHKWLAVYARESDSAAFVGAKQLGVAVPKGVRSIAPTGSIGILAETTTGIEPLFCKAYQRRYLNSNQEWVYQYVVDGAVKRLLEQGIKIEAIQDSYDISFKDRVKFQADVQQYVDMAISSTCNMPSWGSEDNNEKTLEKNAMTLLKYAKRLRGFTVYPDGCREGQPLTRVDLADALANEGVVFEEKEAECVGGVCGI